MRRKARRTLDTALRLIDQGRLDDGVSRLYFAVFQAATYGLDRLGKVPPVGRMGRPYWSHAAVLREVALVRGRKEDRDLLRELRGLRILADYRPAVVLRRDVEALRHEAIRFVEEVTE